LKARGLTDDPELAIGDGALGFWKALPQVWPKTKWQRCWVHKTANVLAKLPKKAQPKAKDALHQIWMAETEKDANKAFDLFIDKYRGKYPRAATCLAKNRDEMLAFYSFPAEHWKHIRTTNAIESTFATVRLRTKRTKGAGSRMASLTMVFKLAQAAERKWRKLDGYELLADVIRGVQFKDGIKVAA
jgi:putative transposase